MAGVRRDLVPRDRFDPGRADLLSRGAAAVAVWAPGRRSRRRAAGDARRRPGAGTHRLAGPEPGPASASRRGGTALARGAAGQRPGQPADRRMVPGQSWGAVADDVRDTS